MSEVQNEIVDASKTRGTRVSGKTWKEERTPFRVTSSVIKNKKFTSWEAKQQKKLEDKQFKDRLKALKDEKEEARKTKIQALKERREKKEEKERYERLAAKMHAKKVDRLRRREKRNKALKER
ncbi:hypothetical protein TPHA_0F00620 [Tetrapisispora phaffii CBS 4417]|uniref:rRNA-processing protein n=1 Tax=Tetrapisispora phaffii (strain ATCC 24235 / CBS 4417 / NBRC 1672 / NRRL Y-8282 / UCD 70-5) TaxID=1071381 RepID=G8BUW7_TETPH|nr:hypothetical protein TPHA_0F00620 [Tetrapisispora phaffii CBS 4417]CCE63549.1 hypothetical protein TPHA_0F00620 [Tetrapisispora phaffii CBS 4417]